MDKKMIQTSQEEGIFVDLSPQSEDLVDLAVEVWRIQNRIHKSSSDLKDIHKRGLESSIKKLLNFLEKSNIEIVDHTNRKYNEGLNVNVLSYEEDDRVDFDFDFIKETIEPTIMHKGSVFRKGKVIVAKNFEI